MGISVITVYFFAHTSDICNQESQIACGVADTVIPSRTLVFCFDLFSFFFFALKLFVLSSSRFSFNKWYSQSMHSSSSLDYKLIIWRTRRATYQDHSIWLSENEMNEWISTFTCCWHLIIYHLFSVYIFIGSFGPPYSFSCERLQLLHRWCAKSDWLALLPADFSSVWPAWEPFNDTHFDLIKHGWDVHSWPHV